MAEPVVIDFEAWPECSHCGTAWVVRRVFTFGDGKMEWLWQRDCKHKAAPRLAEKASVSSESDEYTNSTHRTLPYAVWTKFPDESVEVIQMSGRNAVVAVRRIRSASSESVEGDGQ